MCEKGIVAIVHTHEQHVHKITREERKFYKLNDKYYGVHCSILRPTLLNR